MVDEVERTATFYMWTFSGQLGGYHQHRPDAPKRPQKLGPKLARYFTYRKLPVLTVWGLETFHLFDGPLFVCEGVFDAARLTNRGRAAVAVCCNDPPKDFRNWLTMLSRPTVAVCDDDAAGRKLAKFTDFSETAPDGKDLGDASEEYVNFLLERYPSN